VPTPAPRPEWPHRVANGRSSAAPPEMGRFISDFCQWAVQAGMPERSRRRLPAALRRAVLDELPSRDQDQTAVFRTLVGSNGLT